LDMASTMPSSAFECEADALRDRAMVKWKFDRMMNASQAMG
jgi:hypothetical protein